MVYLIELLELVSERLCVKPLAQLYSLCVPFSFSVLGMLLRRRWGKGEERKVMGRVAGGQGREDKSVVVKEEGFGGSQPPVTQGSVFSAWPFDCSESQVTRL